MPFFLFSFFVDKCGCSSLLWLCYIFGNSFRSPLFIGNSSPSVLLLWYYCSSQKKKKKKVLQLLLMLLFFFRLLICPFLSVKFYYQILLTITCMCILLYYTICYHPFQKKKIKKKNTIIFVSVALYLFFFFFWKCVALFLKIKSKNKKSCNSTKTY